MKILEQYPFLNLFFKTLEDSEYGQTMKLTVENSPWHRESSVWRHTEMCLEAYFEKFASIRSSRQVMLTSIALMAHDIGKPEAEETLEKKEEPGVFYRRYAGHEPISGNEFMSFICDHHELREAFFAQGFGWKDVRLIKVMIEHHLPYGLKNVQKVQNLKQMIERTMEEDEVCFYDMLRSDAAGRISDNHEEKLLAVELWIENFQQVEWKPHKDTKEGAPTLVLLVGVSGAGKSSFIRVFNDDNFYVVFCEDDLRVEYALTVGINSPEMENWHLKSEQDKYDAAWRYCHLNKESKFDAYSKSYFQKLLEEGRPIIVDRMNQGRKARNRLIQPARDMGYRVVSMEFFVSEQTAKNRQRTRPDKSLSDSRLHLAFMQLETPWLGPEVDQFTIIPPSGQAAPLL